MKIEAKTGVLHCTVVLPPGVFTKFKFTNEFFVKTTDFGRVPVYMNPCCACLFILNVNHVIKSF